MLNMFTQMNPHDWLLLSPEVKSKLIEIFKIKRSGFTHVSDGKVITDGYTSKDLSVLNIEAMGEYLRSGFTSETSFAELFEKVINKIVNPHIHEELHDVLHSSFEHESDVVVIDAVAQREAIDKEEIAEEKPKSSRKQRVKETN